MKKIIALALAAGVTLAAAAPAVAADGCGRGFHRGPHGRCWPNGRGPAFVRGPGTTLIIGNHYGQGWWDGHRYWHDRYQDRGGWRYR